VNSSISTFPAEKSSSSFFGFQAFALGWFLQREFGQAVRAKGLFQIPQIDLAHITR